MAIRQLHYPNSVAPVTFDDYQRQNALLAGLVHSGGSIPKISGGSLLKDGYYNYKGILYYGESDTTILTDTELGTNQEGFVVFRHTITDYLVPYYMDFDKQNEITYEPQWGGYYYKHGSDDYLVLRTSVDSDGRNFDNLSMLDTGARVSSSLWVDGDFYSKGKLINFDKISRGGGDGIELTKYVNAVLPCSQAFDTIRHIMENTDTTSGVPCRYLCTGFVQGVKGASDNPTNTFFGTASALTYPDVAKDEADGKIPTITIELGEKGIVYITPQGVRWDVRDLIFGDTIDLDTEIIGLFINW